MDNRNDQLRGYFKGDTVIWAIFIMLCGISVVESYSASSALVQQGNYTAPILSHIKFLLMGFFAIYVMHLIPYTFIRKLKNIMILTSFVLMILLFFVGISRQGNAQRAIPLPGFDFQPIEFVKLSVIIFVADALAGKQRKDENPNDAFKPIIIVLSVFFLLIARVNFSSAFLLFTIVFAMMIIGRISWKKLSMVIAAILLVGTIGYTAGSVLSSEQLGPFHRLKTQVKRVDVFLGIVPEKSDDVQQITQSQIAIANGIIPQGPGGSHQRDYLSYAYSDFVFAIIVEELGIFGGIGIILLFLFLLYRAGKITFNCTQTFPALLVIGLSLMLVTQAFISMAVATGLGPVTGLPLPMISRGGTSIVMTSIYFGIIPLKIIKKQIYC